MDFSCITSNPQILGGKPIVKGTRISVEFILELIASGGSVSQITTSHLQLTTESVQQAIGLATHT